MKRSLALLLALLCLCLLLTGCFGKNYPGNVKSKFWYTEDKTMFFYFPAEAGHGRAEGYFIDGEVRTDLIFVWDTFSGVVEVKTAGYEPIFTANTVTDPEKLSCTFELISQEEDYDFPDKIVFFWQQLIEQASA